MSQTTHACSGCDATGETKGTTQHREHTVPQGWAVITVAPTTGQTTNRKVCELCLSRLERIFT